MIYVFSGNGKGKTTAAIGMALRAAGAGKKVLIVQFLKTGDSPEVNVLEKVKNIKIKSFGRKGFFLPAFSIKNNPKLKKIGVQPLAEEDVNLALSGLDFVRKNFEKKKYNFFVLDEIIPALKFKLLNIEDVLYLLKKYTKSFDIVLTGRDCPKEIIKIADLVTEMKEVKHYYRKGRMARRGVEY